MKDNVWYIQQSKPLENEVIAYFQGAGRWGTVLWNDNEYLLPQRPEAVKAEYSNHKYIDIPTDLHNRMYKHLYTFIDMQARMSPWSSFIYDQKNHVDYLNIFNKMLNITYKKLLDNKISLVIMNRSPHFGGDLLVYLLAKEFNIKTLIMEQSQFPNKYFYYFDNMDYGTFATAWPVNPVVVEEIPNSFEKKLWYMDRLKRKPTLKSRLQKSFENEIRLLKETFTHSGWEQSLHRYALRKRFRRDSENLKIAEINLDVPFVYFPLHLQPEKTTSVWGGIYNDQLLALERLSAKLPDDYKIYVKENPKQKYIMRGAWFYDRLKSIPKVQLVEADTYLLLRHSKFAATITGTVGWESITGGKNVLVFGWGTWYKTLPGVYMFDEGFDLDALLNNKIDHKELEEKLAGIKSKMLTGIVYLAYKKNFPAFNEQENVKMIINNFEEILYKNHTS